MTCHCRIPWKRRPRAFCLFFVYSPYFSLAFTIAPIKLYWSSLRQINKPANKNLFKVSIININFLDFLWKCFDSLNMYSLSCLSRHVSIEPTTEGSWITKVKENLIVLPSLWSDDIYDIMPPWPINELFFQPSHKETIYLVILEKLVTSLKYSIFSMVLGCRTNSAFWL